MNVKRFFWIVACLIMVGICFPSCNQEGVLPTTGYGMRTITYRITPLSGIYTGTVYISNTIPGGRSFYEQYMVRLPFTRSYIRNVSSGSRAEIRFTGAGIGSVRLEIFVNNVLTRTVTSATNYGLTVGASCVF